jgi:hypothetical protein
VRFPSDERYIIDQQRQHHQLHTLNLGHDICVGGFDYSYVSCSAASEESRFQTCFQATRVPGDLSDRA